VRITVGSGAYVVEPGSHHRVRLVEERGQTSEDVLSADDRGQLRIETTVAAARLEIAPE